jgi:hypothetical protein
MKTENLAEHATNSLGYPLQSSTEKTVLLWELTLINNGNTHNFIHRRVIEELVFYVHVLVHNFQIIIINGHMMKCGGKCENVKLQMGDYHLKSQIFSIEMGGCD